MMAAGWHVRHVTVSIRSRRLSAGELKHLRSLAHLPQFQSAPADCRRENAANGSTNACADCFNPLPPTVGGRISAAGMVTLAGDRFNPLPPTVGGRIPDASRSHDFHPVSIRSRRLSAGE